MTVTITRRPTIGAGNLIRSEWTKLRSVRSTYWTGIVAVLATTGLGIGLSIRWQRDLTAHPLRSDGFDATLTSLNGIYLAQVAIGALGVLVISSEYGTGMIRATLGAVPQRRAMLAAKAAVFAACTVAISELTSFLTFGIGQAVLHRARAGASLADPGVLRAVIGGGLYLTAVGMLGFGLGALIRHTAGALSAFFGILFALTAIADLLPTNWRNDVIEYLPANAGSQILTVLPTKDSLPPWTGLGVLCLYALAPIIAAFVLIKHRDA
ncbi:MAG: type transport system permease protein [Pseudonocardiales bacterium]|nr:type transport system permease protein [Pseudonocardiales bacterium]